MTRTALWAFGLSLGLHAALLALVASRPAPPGRESRSVEIDVRYVSRSRPATASPVPAPAATAPPARAPAPVAPAPRVRVPPAASRAGAAPPQPEVAERAGQATPAAGAAVPAPASPSPGGGPLVGPAPGDLPVAAPRGPSAGLGERLVEEGARGSRAWGTLRRNEPGDGPSREMLLEAERGTVQRRVDGWLADDRAAARVRGGVVDDYFASMRRRMEEAADRPPDVLSGSLAKDFASAYGTAAKQYGATGNPYREGEVVGAAPELDDHRPLAQMAQRYQGSTTARVAQTFEQGRVLRDFADGKFGQGLVAILELRQGGDGHLLGARLLEPSGSLEFDSHAMRVAPEALSLLGPPPATVRVPEGGLRSHWWFEGHIVYKRRLRDTTLLQDGWYLALAGMAGLMTGDFDGAGDATYVDLRHPELKVKVRLLRLYQ